MRWKVLPHRLRTDGSCRDCSSFDARHASDACARCALERYADNGFTTIADPVKAFLAGRERWRIIAQHLTSGRIKSGGFYVYAGCDDADVLDLPLGELDPADVEHSCAALAHELGEALLERYRSVWVVTTVGCWNVRQLVGAASGARHD